MSTVEPLPFTQWATIHQTEKGIAVDPLSGYARHLPEDEPPITYLDRNPTDTELGTVLLQALNVSRFIDPDEDIAFFKMDRILSADKRWHEKFMIHFGYKTKRQAYRNMLYCLIERSEGMIRIEPHRRDKKPGLWWDLPPEMTLFIPNTNDPNILGAAAKLALSRCS